MTRMINFISHANENLASHRFRASLPAEFINKYFEGDILAIVNRYPDKVASTYVFMKHINPELDQCFVRNSGDSQTVVFDVCDDHFDRQHGDHYKWMCNNADIVTCTTNKMAERIKEVTGRIARVIPDPINLEFEEFKGHSENPSFLWYGHASNVNAIMPYTATLPNLTIVCNGVTETKTDTLEVLNWTPTKVQEVIPYHDIVLIPTPDAPYVKYKSPNRAVDALNAGKFVITDNADIYGELASFIFIGDINEGIKFYKNNPDEIGNMIEAGQRYVQVNYNEERIAKQWIKETL